MDLEKNFKKFAKEKNLISKDDRILLAVSGGVDSVVMAELFSRSGISFGIAHCNFQLRGEESKGDEDFVRKLAGKYSVPVFVKRFETKNKSKGEKLSVQEKARKQRYRWFAELLSEHRYSFVATAHHLNDSIETFFINLLRGTGISGLRGIPLKMNLPPTIRPMLFAKKEDIENFANENNLAFRLDHSNETDLYLRNKLRHHLMPVLLQLNPQFEKVMDRTLRNLSFAEEMMKMHLTGKFPRIKSMSEGDLIISKEDLESSGFPAETLMAILQTYGFNSSQASDAWNAKTGRQFFSGDYILTSDRRQIILGRKNIQHLVLSISSKDKRINSAALKLSLETRKQETGSFLQGKSSKNNFIVDRQLLDFPLIVRKWEKGDSFYPLGMKGKKKISDFLTDRKVSRPDKEKTYVLLSGDKIVCVLGHRIDDKFKVTGQTKEIYEIEIES
jgi:tRNA(Ile)-lysidine synthase